MLLIYGSKDPNYDDGILYQPNGRQWIRNITAAPAGLYYYAAVLSDFENADQDYSATVDFFEVDFFAEYSADPLKSEPDYYYIIPVVYGLGGFTGFDLPPEGIKEIEGPQPLYIGLLRFDQQPGSDELNRIGAELAAYLFNRIKERTGAAGSAADLIAALHDLNELISDGRQYSALEFAANLEDQQDQEYTQSLINKLKSRFDSNNN